MKKDGERRTGYIISKGFDISQMSGKPLEERPQRSMEELIHAVLKDQPVQMQIADNLPEGIQAQYIPKQRTVYVQNGMEENTTFHAVNRELACAALDQHDGNYVKKSQCTGILRRLCDRQAVWGRRVRFPLWENRRDAGERAERSPEIAWLFK